MAYTYSNWRTITSPAARLAALNSHIAEVTDQMGPDVSSLGHSVSRVGLQQYLDRLLDEARRLEAAVGAVNGGVSLADLRTQA